MATFTIDLISGKVFLFDKDFGTSSGGTTPTGGTGTYPEVNTVAELPSASGNNGSIYVVRTSTGNYILNRKEAGLYISTGILWRRLGDIPSFFDSNNFEIYDNSDNTKGVNFQTSGITTGIKRTLKIQDNDGTVAYLTDLNSKVDLSVFDDYTGITAPNTFLSIVNFNTYSGETLTLINSKQDGLIAGEGININSGNTISVILPSELQLKDTLGELEINSIIKTPIIWTTEEYSGTSLNFTGGSRIYIKEDSKYGVSYLLNLNNETNVRKNIGTIIRKNGSDDITPLSSSSYSRNNTNKSSTNSMPQYIINLNNGDYIELMGFRIGSSGSVLTIPDGNWIKIKKII